MLTLVPGGMGGSETYARAMTRELASRSGLEVTAHVAGVAAGFSDGVTEHVVTGVRGGASTWARLTTMLQAGLQRRAILRGWVGADVVHYPFSTPVPRAASGTPTVVTLLDVQHLDLPHLFSRGERAYRHWFYDRAAREADVVITISEFAKDRIAEGLGIDRARIVVAPLGVDLDDVEPQLGDRENFLLYPARGWPHKNHARLFEAFELLRAEDPTLRLVLTGGGLDALGPVPDGVDVRGLVPAAELRSLYRTASALVFPSLYEGFGLPPLEAMAAGCPVAASDAGSLREVCGQAAQLFDPLDPAAIAAGVRAAMDNSATLRELGLAHVRAFTWDACATAHDRAYRLAVSSRA